MAIVRAEGRIGNRPLTKWVFNGFIVFPLVRVRCVIHPNLEVLRTAEEEVPVVGELTRVASGVVMDDFISGRSWDHVLIGRLATFISSRIQFLLLAWVRD